MKNHILVLLTANQQIKYLPKYSKCFYYIPYVLDTKINPVKLSICVSQKFHDQNIAGIYGINDRSSVIASLVAQHLGLLGPSPESIAKAQHKEISLNLFSQISNKHPHKFVDQYSLEKIKVFEYPIFYRPVKGYLSQDSGFAESSEKLKLVLLQSQKSNKKYITWFEDFFHHVIPKYSLANKFVIEPIIQGRQITVDGFVQNKKVQLLVFSESVQRKDVYSFDRFELPMTISKETKLKITSFLQKFVSKIGYDNSAFNAEFFIFQQDIIHPIEFNTRMSLQFEPMLSGYLSKKYFEILAEISVGSKVSLQELNKDFFACCFILRKLKDKFVVKIPTGFEIEELKNKFPAIIEFSLYCEEKKYLSDVIQDEFSYRYAGITIVGKNKKEVRATYSQANKKLLNCFNFKNKILF